MRKPHRVPSYMLNRLSGMMNPKRLSQNERPRIVDDPFRPECTPVLEMSKSQFDDFFLTQYNRLFGFGADKGKAGKDNE